MVRELRFGNCADNVASTAVEDDTSVHQKYYNYIKQNDGNIDDHGNGAPYPPACAPWKLELAELFKKFTEDE